MEGFEQFEAILRLPKWRRNTLMEIPIFLLVTSWAMSGTIVSDLIVFQTCRKMLGVAKNNACDILHTNSSSDEAMSLERIVQPHANIIIMIKSLVEGVFPALLSLFLGPWSDKYGRKPLLIAAYTGSCLMFISMTMLINWDVDPWVFLICFIPPAVLGGSCSLMLATYCYISDITNNETRAWRLAWLESSLAVGLVVGVFTGPPIFERFGYMILFFVCTLFVASALIWIIFFVPETVQHQIDQKRGNLFDLDLVKELIETSTKKKVGLHRKTLWQCIGVLALLVVVINGELNIGYLFASARLGWDTIQYSNFKGLLIAMTIVGTITGIKLFGGQFGFSDTSLAMMAAVSSFSASMISAYTFQSWHMYTILIAGAFAGVLSPTIRSVLSKSVPPEDVGKVFSLTTSVEAIIPLACGPIYTFVYSNYLPPIYPSPAYLLSGTFFLVIIILIAFIDHSIIHRQSLEYISVVDEE